MAQIRIAVTLEQCWHRVPGGTASSALHAVQALQARPELDLVGVSARHRRPPPEPWTPTIPVRALPMPRLALYESWHRARRPAVERATGPVDVIYVTGMAMPPPSAPLVVTVHDLSFLRDPAESTRHGRRFFERAIELARTDADAGDLPVAGHHRGLRRAGLRPGPAATRAVGDRRARGRRGRGRAGAPHLPAPAALRAVGRDDRAPQEPPDAARGLPPPRPPRARARAHRPAGLERGPRRPPRLGRRPGPRARASCPKPTSGRCSPGPRCSACRACREGFGLPVLEAMAQGAPGHHLEGHRDRGGGRRRRRPGRPPGRPGAGRGAGRGARLARRRRGRCGSASRRRAAELPWSRTADLLEAAFREADRHDRPARSAPTCCGSCPGWSVAARTTPCGCWPRTPGPRAATARSRCSSTRRSAPPIPASSTPSRWSRRRSPAPASRRGCAAEATWLARQARADGIDLVHHMGGNMLRTRPPGMVTIHDLQPFAHPAQLQSPEAGATCARPSRGRCAGPCIVVTLTEHTRHDVVDRMGVAPERIFVVPPGIARGDAERDRRRRGPGARRAMASATGRTSSTRPSPTPTRTT